MSGSEEAEESVDQILESVAAEIDAAEKEVAGAGEQDTRNNLSDTQNTAQLDATENNLAAEQDDPHDSSAAVLEVSSQDSVGESTLARRMEGGIAGSREAPAAVSGVASPDNVSSEAHSTSSAPRSRSATMPASVGSGSRRSTTSEQLDADDELQVVGVEHNPAPQTFTEKLQDFKKWSTTQLICTRQYLSEQLGSGTRTTDTKLSDRLTTLMAQREKYGALLRIALRLCNQVRDIKTTQRELANVLGAFSVRSEELGKEVETNAATQRQLARNGDVLYEALSAFCANLTHLVNTAMEDTFRQLKVYQAARVEYDAYRSDEATARSRLDMAPNDAKRKAYLERKQGELAERKQRFETLRKDLTVRVHFLEQNQLKVMTRQLTLLHNASCAYFTGDAEQLEKCIRQFHIKMPQHLGQDATVTPSAAAAAAAATAGGSSADKRAALEPLAFPTASELGTPSDALTALLSTQLTASPTSPSSSEGHQNGELEAEAT